MIFCITKCHFAKKKNQIDNLLRGIKIVLACLLIGMFYWTLAMWWGHGQGLFDSIIDPLAPAPARGVCTMLGIRG